MENMGERLKRFYKSKKVLVTGHTGFKGAWLCHVLTNFGAKVTGYALAPEMQPNLFDLCGLETRMNSILGDIRDLNCLRDVVETAVPQIVFHMAAQPLVLEGYSRPHYTYDVNVMGTVNILECMRLVSGIESFVNVTTDKVYLNDESGEAFSEEDPLDGFDPYSNSKSCAELVTHSYKNSFFTKAGMPAISTARAGNVIGGGDFAQYRILPDCIRAAVEKKDIKVRNPNSIRPYQHVLEPLLAYMHIAQVQCENSALAGYYNVGPDAVDSVSTGELATLFCKVWGEGLQWDAHAKNAPFESNYLRLNCTYIKNKLSWRPRWHVDEAVRKTVEWAKVWQAGEDISVEMDKQIEEYLQTKGEQEQCLS